jgi:hypothetical protein
LPGDVLYIYCSYIKPQPKQKYVVCVCPDPPLFFFINTEPRSRTLDAQLFVSQSEIPSLQHDSYINTAEIVTFPKNEIDNADKTGTLPPRVRKRVREIVISHRHLSPMHKKIVLDNLT